MTEFNKAFLKSLLSAVGPSSFESRPADLWKKQAESYGATLASDTYGNQFASFGSQKPHVMLSGHIDEIGLMINYIDPNGLLYFVGIGGWDPQQLVGQRVRILGNQKELIGVIGKKAIHLMTLEDRKKASKVENLWIDIGAMSYEDARNYVREGDVAVIEQPFIELLNGRISSKAIDNRIGAYIVLEAARRASLKSKTKVTASATVQEEIGHMGALIAAYGLSPDVAIAVDVTHATDLPGASKTKNGDIALGSGASLSIGSINHRGVFNLLVDCATEQNIPFTIEAAPRKTATDGDDIAKSRSGVPTMVVSVPNRYMHSPNEMIDLQDVEDCIELISTFICRLDENSSFSQPSL